MRIDIFDIPIFIGNIDSDKIIIENQDFSKTWVSETKSSFFSENSKIKEESVVYLLKNISELLKEKIKNPFEINLKNIWSNKYEKNDYQEEHIHSGCHFSFIIYKDVKESRTVFLSAWKDLIGGWEMEDLFPNRFNVQCRSNQICVFPSFVKHMVLRNNYPGETIAGNICIKVNYGKN